MEPGNDIQAVDGIDAQRLPLLIDLLEERASILAPSTVMYDDILSQCQPKSQPFAVSDFALITTEPPAPPEEISIIEGASGRIAAVEEDSGRTAAAEEPQSSDEVVIRVDNGEVDIIEDDRTPPPATNDPAQADTQAESPRSVEHGRARLKRSKGRRIREGTVIQGYEIHELLGAGGMGQVYRATQLSLHREVAFKVLSPRFTANANFRRRFLREARSAGRFHHRNLISVHDVDEYDGMLFFSMDLVSGQSIGDMIDERGALDEDWSLEVIRQCLDALVYAHSRGVIHRDIKPDNIMIAADDVVKIADLGLSRIEDPDTAAEESHVTMTGTMMGTPYYMSPEQSEDAHAADARSDLYSLGATFFHMVCGEVPFPGDNPVTVVVNAATLPLRFPKAAPISPGVRRLIARMMAKDPADRPQSARDCLLELNRVTQSLLSPLRFLRHPAGMATAAIVIIVILALAFGQLAEYNRRAAHRRFVQSVERLAAQSAFAEADRAMEIQALRHPAYSERIKTLRQDLWEAWNAWALEETTADFERVEDSLYHNRFREAMERLRHIEIRQDFCSPAVMRRIETKRAEARDLRHGGVWGDERSLAEEQAIPRDDLLASMRLRDGTRPTRQGDNTYRFQGSGRSFPLPLQRALRRDAWTITIDTGDQTAFAWGLSLDGDALRGRPWCYIGALRGMLLVAVDGERRQVLGPIPKQSPVSFSIEFTATEVIIRHRDQEKRVTLKDDMPLSLRWDLPTATTVAIVPPPSWFE